MKKPHSFVLVIVFVSIAVLAACKKTHDKSRSELLIGSWKITQSVIDSNKNNVMDAGEYYDQNDSNSLLIVFGTDGSMRVSNVLPATTPDVGTWKLINHDSDIFRTNSTGQTAVIPIVSLTGAQLVFFEGYLHLGAADSMRLWTVFTKI